MPEIPLTKGKVVLVDENDFAFLSQWKWFSLSDKRGMIYAARNIRRADGTRTAQLMHRVITDAPSELCVDHINGDTLDNRRSNLRLCTRSQNSCNSRKHIDSKNPYKGVIYNKKTSKWVAQIRVPGVKGSEGHKNLGYFVTPELAHQAYLEAAKELHGEFMRGH